MICSSCQTSNPDAARFCLNCGAPLAPRTVEGERKFATVLFADVVNSTALAESLDPEEWAEIMNGAFGFMNAEVSRYGGTVGRLMGDAILAFFGAPVAYEDHAERAVRAGLAIRDAATQYARGLEASHGVEFRVRVGINTGLSVLTVVGDQVKAEYTAMGDVANVAARLQSLAEPGTVLIGADTYHLVKRLFEVRPRGAVSLKGKAAATEMYEVLDVKTEPGTVRGLEGLSSPLVGRDADFELLRRRLSGLSRGQGGFVAIVGEAGMGKSRLVAELRKLAPQHAVRWLEARALSYTQAVLYYPWRQLMLESIGASEADSAETIRAELQREAGSRLRRPEGDLPFLEALLAAESENSLRVLGESDGNTLVGRIAEAVTGYVGALAQRKPTVLVFDDLHWADPATLELLLRLSGAVEAFPLLLICVLRPDKEAASWEMLARARDTLGERYTELRLELLDLEHAQALLDNLLPIEVLPEQTRRRILEKSEGNPFFLEEVVRALIDMGYLVQEDGRWRMTGEIGELAIPETLIGVLGARIDRLPEATKRVAQTAAVIGRSFAQRVLADVVRVAPAERELSELSSHLGVLTYEELVRERARGPEPEYIFKHALTQEAAYAQLLLRRRKELHRRTGQVLEQLYGDERDEYAPVLAYHFRLGEDWLPAARYAMRAARRALRLRALDDASKQYESALEALEKVPEAPSELLIETLHGWVEVAVLRRMHEEQGARQLMLERLERALALARALGDKRRLTQVLVAKGNVLALSGFPGQGFKPLLEAFDLARELGDEHLALLPYWAATEMMVSRDPRGAAAQFGQVVELARKVKNKAIEAHALGSKALAHARLGEFGEAEGAILRALAVAKESDSVIKEADVNILAGAIYYELGELERGLRHSTKGTQLAESVGGLECACGGYHVTGMGKIQVKQLQGAIADLQRALTLGTGTTMETLFHQMHAAQAVAEFAQGNSATLGRLEEALGDARKLGDDYGIDYALLALGDTHLQLGQPEKAEGYVREALASYREKGMLPYVLRALRLLAAALEAQNRPDEAAQAQAEAQALELQLQSAGKMGGSATDPSAPSEEASA